VKDIVAINNDAQNTEMVLGVELTEVQGELRDVREELVNARMA
jgi:hypothetical protein